MPMMGSDAHTDTRPGRWRLAEVDESRASSLAQATGLSLTVSRILANRSISSAEQARRFIEPDLDREWLDPAGIPGMESAAQRIAGAIRAGESILVFGDFDLDGISSAALMKRGLEALGADVSATVPNRFREGYGLSEASVARVIATGARLIVTVDCGISAGVEVEELLRSGVDVVVSDHHEPGDSVPVGVPVTNPKLGEDCPGAILAGAGVALKLVAATGALLGQPDVWRGLTDLAMLGTVADIVPLIGENRAIVADGLDRTRTRPHVGVAALSVVAGVEIATLGADNVAFALAPRLNAAGRMADPGLALDLLLTDDPVQAEALALALDEHNRVRQAVEQDLFDAATAMARTEFAEGDRAVVLAGEGWHEGVKGIVASRMVGVHGVPAIMFAVEDGLATGSGRSAGSVDLHAAVSECSDLLVRFGGHEAAVGLTVRADDLPAFKARLLEVLGRLPEESFESRKTCEARLDLQDVSVELVSELRLLEPFGQANPRPLFCTDGVFMNARQRVGKTGNHLRFTAFDGVASVPAIAFRCRDIDLAADHDTPVDLAYELSADEWRGRARVQLMVRDYRPHPAVSEYAPAAELVADLFERADEILAREEYSGIEDAESFHTKLAGVTFEGRQALVERLAVGEPLRIERQPDNPYDENAIALFDRYGDQVGFLNRRLAAALSGAIDSGVEYDVEVTDVTGGEDGQSLGVNVLVSRRDLALDAQVQAEERRAIRDELAALDPAALEQALVTAFIGDKALHAAQSEALESLASGQRCLTVMATGRGKSLIFHLHAARRAIRDGVASVFVFPLRALVADQAFHLDETLSAVGLSVCTITGESSPTRRDEVFAGLAQGTVDVLLTTPEFLDHHVARFADAGRVGFVVVDEAHHVGMSRAGHRPAYARLGQAIDALGDPDVLAVTATAGTDEALVIRDTLRIQRFILDATVRENLIVEDRRGMPDKDGYLAALASKGGKAIVYVNSREQSVRLAKMLRKRVPELAMRVAFYNGGLGKAARHAVERAFRDGDLSVVVATSAFGEGVNIPDIRNVVLYHLPFNDVEFNQMCGRAGRDGAPARIHVLFGEKDAKVNEMVLATGAPSRDELAAVYRVLRDRQGGTGPEFEMTNQEIADAANALLKGARLNDKAASTGVGVFRELGLLETRGHGALRRLSVPPAPDRRLELSESVRYAEGLEEQAEFAEYRKWVLSAASGVLLERFNRPLMPDSSIAPTLG